VTASAAAPGVFAPGPWYRLTALGSVATSALAVASGAGGLGTAHRLLASLALPPLIALVVASWLVARRLTPAWVAAFVLFGVAALVPGDGGLHLALAALALAAAAVASVMSLRGEQTGPFGPWRDYITLTKPRIMSLLLLTGGCGMFVGAQGTPDWSEFALMMVGLGLACGGASAMNHVLDADIDKLMGSRTEHRPVATGRVAPSHATEFAFALSALSFALLASTTNVLTAALALGGNLFYVVIYTRYLKRNTVQNIVIGGAAGAFPPLVGFAAASGNLTWAALWLFLVVFIWTPPHFWALAIMIKDKYAAANVPMLPVVRGDAETVKQVLWYSVGLVAFTVVPYLWGPLGVVYLVSALVLGGIFLWLAVLLLRAPTHRRAGALFHYSLLYLALIFVAMAVDVVVIA
jgi:protoheme IX farnesyltransferase